MPDGPGGEKSQTTLAAFCSMVQDQTCTASFFEINEQHKTVRVLTIIHGAMERFFPNLAEQAFYDSLRLHKSLRRTIHIRSHIRHHTPTVMYGKGR